MSDAQLASLLADLGELVEARTRRKKVADFSRYRDDVVGFAEGPLGVTLWDKQRDALRGIAVNARFCHYGANSTGKTFLDAVAILWLIYCRDALCVALSPKEDQLKNQLMRDIKRIWHQAADLPGEVRTMGVLRPDNADSGLLCLAAGDQHRARGYHAPMLAVFLQEAQGLEPWVWMTAAQMATGAAHKVIASGNTDRGPEGEFYKAARTWPHLGLSALDHPNVVTGTEVIPGGPSRESIAQMAADFGVDSPFYIAAVRGEFPKDVLRGLIQPAWIDTAVAFWERGVLTGTMARGQLVFGIDVARSGQDRSVVCVMQGSVIREFVAWQGADLEVTAARVAEVAARYHVRPLVARNVAAEAALAASGPLGAALVMAQPGDPLRDMEHARQALLRFDVIGLGAGPYDRMVHQGYPCEPFNSGEKPVGGDAEARYFNRRAQAYWELRDLLEAGHAWETRRRQGAAVGPPEGLALPPDARDQLIRELCAVEWTVNADRRIQIQPKSQIKVKLGGRSPDFADALTMAVTTDGVLSFDTALGGVPVAF